MLPRHRPDFRTGLIISFRAPEVPKICMWIPNRKFDGENLMDYYPNVCASQPEYGSAFCTKHSKIVAEKGFPTAIRDFMKKCQVDPDCFNKTEKAKIKRVLEQLSNDAEDVITEDASQAQGTTYLLRNRLITNKENSEMLQVDGQCQENEGSRKSSDVEGECRKDLGEKRRLHSWSRGVLVIVGGGFYI